MAFYGSDIVLHQLPGKRNYVTVVKDNGTKNRVHKKVLMMTLMEAHKVFKIEYRPIQVLWKK